MVRVSVPSSVRVVTWIGRLLALIVAVFTTVFTWFLGVVAWVIPNWSGEDDAWETAAIAVTLGILAIGFSMMATAARALPWWWWTVPLVPLVAAWLRIELL